MTDTSAADTPTRGSQGTTGTSKKSKIVRLSQSDVPSFALEQALRVARAIADSYGYAPTRPIHVASAMGVTPSSSNFRGVTGAAVAYGLTTGAYNSAEIGLTPLGTRIVRPTSEGDDLAAQREALLKPRILGEFLRQYDNAALPQDAIGKNVLVEKGVPAERAEAVLALIVKSAESVGFIHENKGRKYVDLSGAESVASKTEDLPAEPQGSPVDAPLSPVEAPAGGGRHSVALSPGVHINIEIHIAADASSETVEDIFKNMRRYVLKPDDVTDDGRE